MRFMTGFKLFLLSALVAMLSACGGSSGGGGSPAPAYDYSKVIWTVTATSEAPADYGKSTSYVDVQWSTTPTTTPAVTITDETNTVVGTGASGLVRLAVSNGPHTFSVNGAGHSYKKVTIDGVCQEPFSPDAKGVCGCPPPSTQVVVRSTNIAVCAVPPEVTATIDHKMQKFSASGCAEQTMAYCYKAVMNVTTDDTGYLPDGSPLVLFTYLADDGRPMVAVGDIDGNLVDIKRQGNITLQSESIPLVPDTDTIRGMPYGLLTHSPTGGCVSHVILMTGGYAEAAAQCPPD